MWPISNRAPRQIAHVSPPFISLNLSPLTPRNSNNTWFQLHSHSPLGLQWSCPNNYPQYNWKSPMSMANRRKGQSSIIWLEYIDFWYLPAAGRVWASWRRYHTRYLPWNWKYLGECVYSYFCTLRTMPWISVCCFESCWCFTLCSCYVTKDFQLWYENNTEIQEQKLNKSVEY